MRICNDRLLCCYCEYALEMTIMKDQILDLEASKFSTTKSDQFMDMVHESPYLIVHRGEKLYRATIDLPIGKKVSQVMVYSEFSRHSKKAFAKKLRGKHAIEVVCGYGHGREKSFYLSN